MSEDGPAVSRTGSSQRPLNCSTAGLAALVLAGFVGSCTPPDPPPPRPPAPKIAVPSESEEDPQRQQAARTDGLTGGKLLFEDRFERPELGADWLIKHAGEWLIDKGQVKAERIVAEEVRNQGLWLQRKLPAKVRLTFRARSLSRVGDTKCEIFATDTKHEAGYSIIFGGWNNTINTITRQGEHEPRRVVQSEHQRVEPQRTYTWTIVRTDHIVRWYIDGKFMIAYVDANPVRGSYFAFNNWSTDVRFDDLQVFEL